MRDIKSKYGSIRSLNLESFVLLPKKNDKWFLAKDNGVVALKSIYFNGANEIRLKGHRINNLCDVFEYPIKSSLLNIYKCKDYILSKSTDVYEFTCIINIQCKLVCIE